MRHQTVVLAPQAPARWSVVPARHGRLRTLTIVLLSVVLLLVAIGVLMVQSASQVVAISAGRHPLEGVLRQGAFAALGIALMLGISRVPTAVLRRGSWALLLLGFSLQVLVYSPLGYEAGGNRNWLRLGPISMQPAEFMKFVLLVWVSAVLATKARLLDRWPHVVIPILPVVAASMFINILGGDLGTLVILAALVFGCLCFSRVRGRILAGIAGVAALGIAAMTLTKPNRVVRIMHFFEVDCLADAEHAYAGCWQTLNGFWALANGGVLGVGVGNSTAKWHWLPEAENDFVFAILGEELGVCRCDDGDRRVWCARRGAHGAHGVLRHALCPVGARRAYRVDLGADDREHLRCARLHPRARGAAAVHLSWWHLAAVTADGSGGRARVRARGCARRRRVRPRWSQIVWRRESCESGDNTGTPGRWPAWG